MKFFNELERKYRKYAISNLMYYITIIYAIGMVIWLINPMIYIRYLSLDVRLIMQGQVWRLFTFLFYPPFGGGSSTMMMIFLGVLLLPTYYNLGRSLEHTWGTFRFNVYFFMGFFGQIAAAFVGFYVFKQELWLTTEFLSYSIFLAFALSFPEHQFWLYGLLPIKAKWLAVAGCAIYLYSFIFSSLSGRVEILLSLGNVIIFFFLTRNYKKYSPKEIKRKSDFKNAVKIQPAGATRHRCAVCGRTEKDGDDLEFRYCSKCEGSYEYCQDHLYTHQHVKAADHLPPNS